MRVGTDLGKLSTRPVGIANCRRESSRQGSSTIIPDCLLGANTTPLGDGLNERVLSDGASCDDESLLFTDLFPFPCLDEFCAHDKTLCADPFSDDDADMALRPRLEVLRIGARASAAATAAAAILRRDGDTGVDGRWPPRRSFFER